MGFPRVFKPKGGAFGIERQVNGLFGKRWVRTGWYESNIGYFKNNKDHANRVKYDLSTSQTWFSADNSTQACTNNLEFAEVMAQAYADRWCIPFRVIEL